MTVLTQNELDEFVKRMLDFYNFKNHTTEKIEAFS